MTDPQVIVNLGTGGSDLNGQNGSTSSADSNDARFLDWPGDNAGNYVYLPGVAGNYLSVPDEAALDITGDIDIRVRVAMDDWTPGSISTLLAKWGGTGSTSWLFQIRTDGKLALNFSTDGSTGNFRQSTVGNTFVDGETKWVRCTLDVDDGSGNHVVKFFSSDDGVTYAQLGSDVSSSGTVSLFSGSAAVEVGSITSGGSTNSAGKFYRAQVLDGIDGTPVLDVDTSVITSGAATSFTDLTGNHTVTINRSTSGRKSVAVVSPVWLFGTDDFMEVADNALLDFGASDSFTVFGIYRLWSSFSGNRMIVDKGYAPAFLGYSLATSSAANNSTGWANDGTSSFGANSPNALVSGDFRVDALVIDRATDTLRLYNDNSPSTAVDISSMGSVSTNSDVFIGRRSITATFLDMELLGIAVFRRALTAAEINAVTTYYQNRLS